MRKRSRAGEESIDNEEPSSKQSRSKTNRKSIKSRAKRRISSNKDNTNNGRATRSINRQKRGRNSEDTDSGSISNQENQPPAKKQRIDSGDEIELGVATSDTNTNDLINDRSDDKLAKSSVLYHLKRYIHGKYPNKQIIYKLNNSIQKIIRCKDSKYDID